MATSAAPETGSLPELTPGRFRGPFTRWPRAADAVLALVIFAATVTFAEGPGDTVVIRTAAEVPIPYLLLFAAAAGALYWRRRAPVVALGVVVAAWAATLGSGYADLGGVTIIALYGAGRYAADPRWRLAGLVAALAVLSADGLTGPASWGDTGFGAVVLFVAWYVGRRMRLRSDRAAQRLRDQAAEASRIVTEERARIARELHDVVAHRVSLMTVQAGAAKAVVDQDPAEARQAMAAVEEAGRQALDELRQLLGVLRPEPAPEPPGTDPDLGPQPGLADLSRLVTQVREAGLEVAVTAGSLPANLPARVDLFAYRIVQEALTNVLKHAGPGTRAEVRLGADRDALTIEVRDEGRDGSTISAPDAGPGGQGHGIVGMRERALLLGGRLEAGPLPAGGFRVSARLPMGGESG